MVRIGLHLRNRPRFCGLWVSCPRAFVFMAFFLEEECDFSICLIFISRPSRGLYPWALEGEVHPQIVGKRFPRRRPVVREDIFSMLGGRPCRLETPRRSRRVETPRSQKEWIEVCDWPVLPSLRPSWHPSRSHSLIFPSSGVSLCCP